jgi:glycosyltransferase involved in cell wall biosynthesis
MPSETSVKGHLICTIITPNYLDRFLVLGASIAAAMPSVDLRVLVLQDCSDVGEFQERINEYLRSAQSSADHRAITVDDCEWGPFDVESAALFYSILEFATSVKPALLRSFIGEGWERVTYLDPDIQVFEDFSSLLDSDSDVALTPHLLSNIPKDDFLPTTNDVLMAGFFNLGFCSVGPSAAPFLDWWSDQLQFDCLADHSKGQFTDQKIVDLAPLRAKVQVVTNPGCNVAYWNLHERSIVRDDRSWVVQHAGKNGPLYFFHFSGFVLDRTPSMSVYANREVLGEAVPRSFANQYDEKLLKGVGLESIEFTLGGASLKHALPSIWNRAIREDCEVHVRAGFTLREVREQIYAPRDPTRWETCQTCGHEHSNFGTRVQSFLAGWACHPSIVGVPNAASAFFRGHRHEYRAPAMEQLTWAAEHLSSSLQGREDLVAEVVDAAGRAIRDAVSLKIVGYFTYAAGIGQMARWTLRTLEKAGMVPAVERVFVGSDSSEYLSQILRRDNPLAASNASVLCFINFDQWENHIMEPRRLNPTVEHVEVVWAWELEHIPAQMYSVAASGAIQRVHALSKWSAEAMSKVLPVPVRTFSPFDLTLIDVLGQYCDTDSSDASTTPYILTTFDAKSLLSRKNPEGALIVWQRIQDDYPHHTLVIKSTSLRELAPPKLLDLIDATPRTLLMDKQLSEHEYYNLLGQCDAFVSLHRSEGMGLTPIEAGLCGLPVVYTNYGGVTNFLEEGFFPVSYSMTQVSASDHDSGPYEGFAWWAEPDLQDAERQLRRVLDSTRDEIASSLLEGRDTLCRNLVSAQASVVETARRLLESVDREDRPADHLLIEKFETAIVVEDDEETVPDPNPVLFALVNVAYRIYQLFPRRLRQQINVSLRKLRGEPDEQ